jgi:hypothetical protein
MDGSGDTNKPWIQVMHSKDLVNQNFLEQVRLIQKNALNLNY